MQTRRGPAPAPVLLSRFLSALPRYEIVTANVVLLCAPLGSAPVTEYIHVPGAIPLQPAHPVVAGTMT